LPTVSDAELQVLKFLWEHGPATVRQAKSGLQHPKRRWAYNTVLTLMSRLKQKGYVTSKKAGVAHVFQAAVSRDKLLRHRLADLADRVCDGTASPLVHALVKGGRFSPEEIEGLRQLIDELDETPN
jgi:predicted transcriptional regulator